MEFPAIIVQPSSLPSVTPDGKPNITHDILEKGFVSQSGRPQKLKLWGLSLGMTLDLMSYMVLPAPSSTRDNSEAHKANSGSSSPLSPMMQLPYQTGAEGMRMDVVAPSLASVFPRFSYPDVNFWIWWVVFHCGSKTVAYFHCRVFGKRYREVVRGWEASVRGGGTNDRRLVFACLFVRFVLTRPQNKLVRFCAEYILCCDSQGSCGGYSRPCSRCALRSGFRHLVDIWTVV